MNILARTALLFCAAFFLPAFVSAADPAKEPVYIAELKSPDAKVRHAAIESLDELHSKNPAFASALPALLCDPDDSVRWLVSGIIAKYIPDGAERAKIVLPMLDTTPLEMRRPLFEVLKEAGPHARPALRKFCSFLSDVDKYGELEFTNLDFLRELAFSTGTIKAPVPLTEAEEKDLDDDAKFERHMKIAADFAARDSEKRLSAALYFTQFHNVFGNTIPAKHSRTLDDAYAKLLIDPDLDVRRLALWLFANGQFNTRVEQAPLLALHNEKDVRTRSMALRALGALKPDSATLLPLIKTHLKSTEREMLFAAVGAAQSQGSDARDAAADLIALLKSIKLPEHSIVLKALAAIEAPETEKLMIEFADSPDDYVRKTAVEHLRDHKPEPAVGIPIFLKALRDSNTQLVGSWGLTDYGFHARAALPSLFEEKVDDQKLKQKDLDEIIQKILDHRYRGGFSDTPQDGKALTPPAMTEADQRDAVRRIEPFLNSQQLLRADQALQAIASFEKAELPAAWKKKLLERLGQPGDGMLMALKTLAYTGPRAAEFLPAIDKDLNALPLPPLVHALRSIGSTHTGVIEILAKLTPRSQEAAHALAESPKGREILIAELYSKDNGTRLIACTALSKRDVLPPEAAEPLWLLTKSSDANLAATALTALLNLEKLAPPSLDEIGKLLDSGAPEVRAGAIQLCERLGTDATPLREKLLKILLNNSAGGYQAASALAIIGLDDASAQRLAAMPPLGKDESGNELNIVTLLAGRPVELLQFLKARPTLFVSEKKFSFDDFTFSAPLLEVFSHSGPEYDAVRELFVAKPSLSWISMAAVGDPKFLPRFDADFPTADAYCQKMLTVCMRACGRPDGRAAVRISATEPGNFKPDSAWPNADRTRMSRRFGGHGDGSVPLLITGTLKLSDGAVVKNPRFYGTNDRYLLGESKKNREQIRFNAQTGRFVYCSEIFAAFQGGEQPGPYQTGSAETLIESDNAEPLKVQFYDEMPDVEIVLTPKKK